MSIFLTSHQKNFDIYPQDTYIYKRYINNNTIEQFKTTIANHDWEYITYIECPNKAYDTFLGNFLNLYEETFPKVKIKLKSKSLLSPWITKGLIKSSRTKHKLYDKFLKNKTYKNETTYKDYKNLFEKFKFKSSKVFKYILLYCLKDKKSKNLITKHKNNIKQTWRIIKEVINRVDIKCNKKPRALRFAHFT